MGGDEEVENFLLFFSHTYTDRQIDRIDTHTYTNNYMTRDCYYQGKHFQGSHIKRTITT